MRLVPWLTISLSMSKKTEVGGLWKVSPGVFEIFLIVEKHFRANVTNQKRKIDVQRCQH